MALPRSALQKGWDAGIEGTTRFSTLARGDRVELRGFGAFSTRGRGERIGRNPRTGDEVAVPGKVVPHFKAGKELLERLNLHNGRIRCVERRPVTG